MRIVRMFLATLRNYNNRTRIKLVRIETYPPPHLPQNPYLHYAFDMPVTFELGQDHQDKHQNVKELLVKAFEKSAKVLPRQCDSVTDEQKLSQYSYRRAS